MPKRHRGAGGRYFQVSNWVGLDHAGNRRIQINFYKDGRTPAYDYMISLNPGDVEQLFTDILEVFKEQGIE